MVALLANILSQRCGPNGRGAVEDLAARQDGWRRRTLLCDVRLAAVARTEGRAVPFKLFSQGGFDKCQSQGLNVIYRRHGHRAVAVALQACTESVLAPQSVPIVRCWTLTARCRRWRPTANGLFSSTPKQSAAASAFFQRRGSPLDMRPSLPPPPVSSLIASS
jgi:hypothetical protein